jgi:hypothetical protein
MDVRQGEPGACMPRARQAAGERHDPGRHDAQEPEGGPAEPTKIRAMRWS